MTFDMMELFATYYRAMKEAAHGNRKAVVPEPEFKPFKLAGKTAGNTAVEPVARAVAVPTVTPAREARTLAELGVPRALAHELETALRAMGMTRGEKVTGFTFRTVDGAAYALKTAAPARKIGDLAA